MSSMNNEDRGQPLVDPDERGLASVPLARVVAAGEETLIEPEWEEREKIDAWLIENGDPITPDAFAALSKSLELPTPTDDNYVGTLFRALWQAYRIIPASGGLFYRPRTEPLPWFAEIIGLADTDGVAKRLPRRSIAPAFVLGANKDVGHISSSQISEALFEACIAPKEAWSATTKSGWPGSVGFCWGV